MNIKNDQVEWQLNIDKTITEIEKNQAELRKIMSDTFLSDSNAQLVNKKVKWYEISMLFIVFGLGIALAKIFL